LVTSAARRALPAQIRGPLAAHADRRGSRHQRETRYVPWEETLWRRRLV